MASLILDRLLRAERAAWVCSQDWVLRLSKAHLSPASTAGVCHPMRVYRRKIKLRGWMEQRTKTRNAAPHVLRARSACRSSEPNAGRTDNVQKPSDGVRIFRCSGRGRAERCPGPLPPGAQGRGEAPAPARPPPRPAAGGSPGTAPSLPEPPLLPPGSTGRSDLLMKTSILWGRHPS